MAVFRFLHASDFHFSDKYVAWKNEITSVGDIISRNVLANLFHGKNIIYPSTFDKDVAIAFARYVENQKRNIDALLISGDLATTGNEFDLLTAKNYFLGNIPGSWRAGMMFQSSVISADLLTISIPGNHDRYKPFFRPGGKNYERVFGDDWSLTDSQPKLKVYDGPIDEIRYSRLRKRDETIYVFSIDFALKRLSDAVGVKGLLGQGKAYKEIISSLMNETAKCKADTSGSDAIIWMVHFPTSDAGEGVPQNSDLRLIDEEYLVEAAQECGVPIILAGHVHKQCDYSLLEQNWFPRIFCAGTACSIDADEEGNKFQQLDIHVENGRVVDVYKQDIVFNDIDASFSLAR